MKKTFLLFVIFPFLLFVSCKEEETLPLNGTSWMRADFGIVNSVDDVGDFDNLTQEDLGKAYRRAEILVFHEDFYIYTTEFYLDEDGDSEFDEEELKDEFGVWGTYNYNHPAITLTSKYQDEEGVEQTSVLLGTMSDKKIIFVDEDSNTLIFTRS